jgi:hypothetical protein
MSKSTVKSKQNQVKTLPSRLLAGPSQENPFAPAKQGCMESFGPRPSFQKDVEQKQPVVGGLQKNSTSYFPQVINRMSSLSNKLSDVSEVVEATPALDGSNKSFDTNPEGLAPAVQRHSFHSSGHSSFLVEDGDDSKYPYNSKKIFVGGLPHGITDDEFKAYFSRYGEIEDCVVMHDRASGKPRGFGFITYKDDASIDLVLKHKFQHKIHNKWIECKRATPKQLMNESTSVGFESAMNTSYTYSNDMILLPGGYQPFARKFSYESIPFTS